MSTFKDVNRIFVVAMLQLANINRRFIILDDEIRARRRRWGWDGDGMGS